MYTDDNNSDHDNDGDEKVFFIQLILIKTMGIKTLYLTEEKIRIRLGFKSWRWGAHGNNIVILRLFCFAFQLTFWTSIRCNSNRKSISLRLIIAIINQMLSFFPVRFNVHKC